MASEIDLHPVQSNILLVLLFKPEAKFVELNKLKVSNDHFTFHLKRLIDMGFIQKKPNSKYILTTKGKEFSNRFDTENVTVERQAKTAVLIVGVRKNNKGEPEYLVQQRLKQPYYGFYGFVTGKVKWGETVSLAASREFEEETGLKAKMTLVGIKHKMDYSKKGELLEDKFFYVFRASNTKGRLVEEFEGGRNSWLAQNKIFELHDLFDGVRESIDLADSQKLSFVETKYKVHGY